MCAPRPPRNNLALLMGALAVVVPPTLAQPVNDDCEDAILIGEGTHPFSTIGATTDGPSPCAEQGADIWFRHRADFNGTLTASTCTPALTFDTVLGLYNFPLNPRDCPGTFRSCNDDDNVSCQAAGSTVRRLRVAPHDELLIQVGGHDAEEGEGELVIASCPGDFDADGVISLTDLALLVSDLGPGCGAEPCPTDMDGDDDVDLADLALLLSLFGADCP